MRVVRTDHYSIDNLQLNCVRHATHFGILDWCAVILQHNTNVKLMTSLSLVTQYTNIRDRDR